jgi:hypothetical protein
VGAEDSELEVVCRESRRPLLCTRFASGIRFWEERDFFGLDGAAGESPTPIHVYTIKLVYACQIYFGAVRRFLGGAVLTV